ncbi:MAG TPA: cupredoxin domain-containing protein [Acidobacteriota bacterium]|nr:cupredoxin domain-containing protein [Acidobacteriota bacterium]
MIRKFLVSLFLFFAAVSVLNAQQTLTTLSLSADFNSVAGTPRVVRNGFKHFWVTVWRQQGNPAKLVSRIIQSDGTVAAPKVLISGVSGFEGAFDIMYDTINYTYLLAFETTKGLQVQFYNANFVKTGSPVLIEDGLTNSLPRLAYDETGKRFTIFYVSSKDGVAQRELKSRSLDAQGKPLANADSLATAAAGMHYGSLSVSTNSKSGNMLVLVQHGSTNSNELLGYAARPDGSLLKTAPLRLQPATVGLNTMADASFASDGSGFALWSDRTAVKFRKLSATMGFAGATKSIAGAADGNSQATSLVLDSRNGQYLPVWTKANQAVSAAFNLATGAVIKAPFNVAASALTNSRNAATSYDPSQGNALVVWEDSSAPAGAAASGATFRVRAAIFFLAGTTSSASVTVGDNFFSPSTLTVQSGTTVQWVFSGRNPHTVTSSTGVFDSPQMTSGNFEFRFATPGTFNYFCRVHGQAMSGTITVSGGNEPPTHY